MTPAALDRAHRIVEVDTLEALLDGPRARGAFLLRALLEPPWSLRIEDEAPLTIVAVLRGRAWLHHDDGAPVEVAPGSVLVVRGPDHYTVSDAPDREPDVVVLPGGRCTSVDAGTPLWDERALGVRTWGTAGGSCEVLVGTYEGEGETSRPLLSALPRVVWRPQGGHDGVLDLLLEQLPSAAPGQRALLDRLLDVLLISTLRDWFTEQEEDAPGWFRAHQDPVVASALALLHRDVAHAWTVEELAAEVGVSRAALGRRFGQILGQSPIAYLTGWRLSLAADLLCSSDATVAAVARRVGYASPFSLSAAFKRAHGVSPQDYRRGPRPLIAGVADGSGG